MAQFRKLFEPIRVGRLEFKNRIFVLGLAMGYTPDFYINDRFKAFYKERAEGGAGAVTIGIAFPSNLRNSPYGHALSVSIGIWNDSFIPGLKEVVDIVHQHGAKAICQVGLQYHWQKRADVPGEVVGPSAVSTRRGIQPRELTVEEIQQLVMEFGDATERVREAGCDAVEYHAGIGYLINRFLSPISNLRSDDYGGSLEKRARFLLEIIADAKKKAGSDYTYICRISAEEFVEGGNTLEDSKQIAVLLEKASVDCLNVQVGWHESRAPVLQNFVAPGAFAYASEAIKSVVGIPIAIGCRINDPLVADQILAESKADLVGMARALIADPYLPRKAREWRLGEIRPCIACGHCLDTTIASKPMECAVNPRAGKEIDLEIQPAPRSKKILVIGGGPAGMEVATVAAQRGHTVTLIEEGERLGGQLLIAAVPSYKRDLARYTSYLCGRMRSAGVKVRLAEKVTPSSVTHTVPEAVIIATGAIPVIPDIAGVDRPNVASAIQVLKGEKEVGASAIVVGSGLAGCETAEFLWQQGKRVTILEALSKLGPDIGVTTRPFLLDRLRQAGIAMEANATVVEITGKGVRAQRNGQELSFEVDSVVLATGMKPNNELLEELKGGPWEIYSVGDCVEPRRIVDAVAEAAELAYRI